MARVLRKGSDFIKNRYKIFIIGLFFFVCMMISGIFAVITQDTSSVLKTGVVDIKLDTYKLNDSNEEVEYVSGDKLSPGEVISFIPKVSNLGTNCYLRMKINYINNSINYIDYISGLSSDFTKYGEYYYYNSILNENDIVTLFDKLTIPDNIESLISNNDFKMDITVEAIQASNFEPDYTLVDPWGGIIPAKNLKVSYDIQNDFAIKIKYENNTDKDVFIPNNFFDEIDGAMPGDKFNETITIKNSNNRDIEYFLQIDKHLLSDEEISLLSQIDFKILDKSGNTLFDGKLNNDSKISLGKFNSNQEEEIEFIIDIPKELSNEYSLINPKLCLIFLSDYKEQSTPIIIPESLNVNNIGNAIQKIILLPKTGDKIDLIMSIFLLSTIGLIISIILEYREKKRK